MEIQEFQKKLAELYQNANENGKILKGDQIRSFFDGMDLTREQLLQIFRYFKSQGIHIEGISFSDEQESQPVETEEEKEKIFNTLIELNVDGIEILVRLLQNENASLHILVTVDGIVYSVPFFPDGYFINSFFSLSNNIPSYDEYSVLSSETSIFSNL